MIGQIYHVGAVYVQKCSISILHNQLAVRHDQRHMYRLCFQSENLLLKKSVVVGCFSSVILGLSMVDRS